MERKVADGIEHLIEYLKGSQSRDGSWSFPFETGIATDCYMIILLRSLEIHEEDLIKELTRRIVSRQKKNGAWKLFYDEGKGNVTATVEAYYALLYSGYYRKEHPRLRAARRFILANGGLEKTHMLTKVMLAMTGQYKWPATFPVPLEFNLLPATFPINFYQLSVFGRANLLPIMVLAQEKFSLKTDKSPDLSELLVRNEDEWPEQEWRSFYKQMKAEVDSIVDTIKNRGDRAKGRAKQYMLSHIEKDGTLLSYFSSTFLMIFALLSLGYDKSHPVINRAVKGLVSMKTEIKGHTHMQYTTANVWNTGLITDALQEAGLSLEDPVVKSANHYLLSRQHHLFGDWVIHNPGGLPGGWGFSNINTFNPDVDDTTAALRAISPSISAQPEIRRAWNSGLSWLLSMQNDDGGWPAFERKTNNSLLKLLPIDKAEFLLADPASPDLTGRTFQFLGTYTNLSKEHQAIKRGIRSLLGAQEENGSWYGRWGICYLYGTWSAVTGLMAVGVLPTHPSILKGVEWLESVQNEDGGWGESCKSDSRKRYVPLNASTLTHTAWAVDALIAAADKPSKTVKRGVQFLLDHLDREDWTTDYPKGQGMAGDFYIHYHSYRYVFPLLALAHYQRKYEK